MGRNSRSADAKVKQAVRLLGMGHAARAMRLCREVLNATPQHFDARHLLGLIALREARFDEAAMLLEGALRTRPNNTDALSNYANALLGLGRVEAALSCFDRAIALEPGFAGFHFNRANTLAERLDRPLEALEGFTKAIALQPDHAEAIFNRGNLLGKTLGRFAEALVDFERALRLQPDLADRNMSAAMFRLMLGDFAGGWPAYEWRWRTADHEPPRGFPQPQWSGAEAINGRILLLYADQGYGDTLQFCRYVDAVLTRGATVVLEVQPAPAPLLREWRPHIDIVARGAALPAFDLHCPLPSLPLAFATRLETITADIPYLCTAPARVAQWRARLGDVRGVRVGLAWSGNATHGNDANRSIRLRALADILSLPCQFVGLQTEVRDEDREVLDSSPNILDFAASIGDFRDTAALVECVDLVISVDTSAAHLAGRWASRLG
jgi:tetratricopeptide (TPR) repeat protein